MEEIYVKIMKCYLSNFVIWERYIQQYSDDLDIKASKLYITYKENLNFFQNLLKSANLNKDELEILYMAVIYKNGSIESIAKRMHYSESGLRNKINSIYKKLIIEINDDVKEKQR